MNNFYQSGFADKRKTKEINVRELYKVVKRHMIAILVVTILAAAAGVMKSTASVKPLYQSSSRIIIGADEESRKTLQVIIRDSTVLDLVIKRLNLPISSEALANQITVTSIDSSQVVSISVTNPDPNMAARIADTTAQVFEEEVPNIVGKDYIRLLSKAKVSYIPINKSQNNTILIAAVIGLVLGIGLAFLLDSLDGSIQSEEEIEKVLGLPVLGRVSKMKKKNIQRSKKKLELELRGESIGSK